MTIILRNRTDKHQTINGLHVRPFRTVVFDERLDYDPLVWEEEAKPKPKKEKKVKKNGSK